ncbi:MAG: metallophosphoesterase, partial [Anaerolineae bacterium]|nr:metallophosphoesterase [Anaerolineae bacterium]
FDTLIRLADLIESLPAPIFAALLFALALVPTLGDLPRALMLASFFFGDWLILVLLPRAHKSFGPAKPPTLALAMMRLPFALLPTPLDLLAQIVGSVLVVYAFWIEPHRVHLTRQILRSPKFKPNTPPLRVLHLSDLHIERLTERERAVLERARQLQPDVIVFSGDFLNLSNVEDPVAWEHARAFLRELRAPLGVYVVSGSPPVDKAHVLPQLLEGLDNIRWLRDERVTVMHHGQPIDLVGITCTHNPQTDGASLDNILHGDPDDFTLLLYHTPDLAPIAAAQGVDLQLSGHTHGGQIRAPFFGAFFTSSLYGKRFEAGRYQLDTLTLYVSRGIGLEGKGAPRARFLCPPEIVLWEITAP